MARPVKPDLKSRIEAFNYIHTLWQGNKAHVYMNFSEVKYVFNLFSINSRIPTTLGADPR